MHHTTWEEVVDRANKGRFADVLIEQRDNQKRGPIKQIRCEDGRIAFVMLWWGLKLPGKEWQSIAGITEVSYFMADTHSLEADNEGTVTFLTPHSKVQIFSTARRNSTLDPSEVVGLKSNEVRQSRAREYQLPLDATWGDIVEKMRDWASDGGVSVDDQIRIQDEAAQFA